MVDDSSLVRLYYRSALEKAGFEVEQAINGIEAMERVLSEPFDLVIVDVNMPRMDGFTFLRSLRSGAADVATLPALMISTESGNAGYRRSQSGRCEFLSREAGGGSRTGSTCLRSHGSCAVSALQEQFVTEARELIRQATDNLIALERDGTSPERIDSVFRAFHTLKGSAGVVELPAMSIMLHAAEDLLAGVRHGTLGVSAEHHRCCAGLSRSGVAMGRRLRGCRRVTVAGRRGWPRDGGTVAIVFAGPRQASNQCSLHQIYWQAGAGARCRNGSRA